MIFILLLCYLIFFCFFPFYYLQDFRIYKNILQALLQKEMKPLPIYKTAIDGPLHIPSFQSTVEVEGELFVGNSAKSKKQAEQNAAKVAYNILKERTSMLPT